MKKRLLSTLLAVCLALSLLPSRAAAADTTAYEMPVTLEAAVEMLNAVAKGEETRKVVFLCYQSGDTRIVGNASVYQPFLTSGEKYCSYVFTGTPDGALTAALAPLLPDKPQPQEVQFPAVVVYNKDNTGTLSPDKYIAAHNLDASNVAQTISTCMITVEMKGKGSDPILSGGSSENPPSGGVTPITDPKYGPPEGFGIAPEAWEVLRLTNQHRMNRDGHDDTTPLEPLSIFKGIVDVANQRAIEIHQDYRPDHTRPVTGASWTTALEPYGNITYYDYAAENLASGQKNSAAAYLAWYNSAPHHRNMDSSIGFHIGVGYCYNNENYSARPENWAQNFIRTRKCDIEYDSLKLSANVIIGINGTTLEELLTLNNIAVLAKCKEPQHGDCALPLIAGMCSKSDGTKCDTTYKDDQTFTVTYWGRTTQLLIKAAGTSVDEEDVPKQHMHEWETPETTAPTCTQTGATTRTCSTCNAIEVITETPATGHNFQNSVCSDCNQELADAVYTDMITYPEEPESEDSKTWEPDDARVYVQKALDTAKTENKYPAELIYTVQPATEAEGGYFKNPEDGTAENRVGVDGYYKYIITIADENQGGSESGAESRRARDGETEAPGQTQTDILTLNLPAKPYEDDSLKSGLIKPGDNDDNPDTPPSQTDPPSPPPHTHSWNSGRVTKEPACTVSGVRTFSCSGCTQTKTETIPALGHKWGSGEVTTPATCGADGVLTKTCTRAGCNETRTEAIPATGEHEWDEGSFSGDCAEGGVRTYKCAVCGETKTETVPAGEHSWDGGKLASGSCTDGGTQTFTCTVCGRTRTEDLPADGHTWDNGEVTTEPTCTESGVKIYTCARCGETRTEAVPALGHKQDDGTVTKTAACAADGERVYACSVCKETLKTEIIPATGHNFVVNDAGGYTCQNQCGTEIGPELRNPYEEIQKELDKSKGTVTVTGADGKTETIPEQKVQVLPAGAVADKTNTNAVKAAVQAYLEKTVQNIINRVSDAAWRIASKVEVVRVEPGVYKEEPGAWYVCQVTLSRTAIRVADELKTEEIWVFVSDKRETVSNSEETYYISIPKSDGGEMIPNTRYAAYGERVTLSVHPDKGYELDSLTVKDVRGRELALRELSGGQYAFYMPACKVTVTAAFIKAAAGDAPASPDNAVPGTNHTTADPSAEPFTGLGTPGISGIVLRPGPMPFTDVPAGSWYYNGAEYMWKHYLMSGVSDTRFAPNATTSRAMIWTVLARMNNVRTDINPGSTWYERGMLWAVEKGLTDGTNPMGDITREQLAAMLWRNAGQPGGANADLSRFSDAASISGYAKGAVQWAVAAGVLNGSDGKLNPQGTATRAEVAVMIMRYAEKAA